MGNERKGVRERETRGGGGHEWERRARLVSAQWTVTENPFRSTGDIISHSSGGFG